MDTRAGESDAAGAGVAAERGTSTVAVGRGTGVDEGVDDTSAAGEAAGGAGDEHPARSRTARTAGKRRFTELT